MNQPSYAAVDHTLWNTLLTHYVDTNGCVAYRDLQGKDAPRFEQYLMTLAQAQLAGLSEAEEKAFWINAYNAVGSCNRLVRNAEKSTKKAFRSTNELHEPCCHREWRSPRVYR